MAESKTMRDRWIIDAMVTTESTLRIGSGEVDEDAPRSQRERSDSDKISSAKPLACALNGDGLPYIPGSTLKGALRSRLRASRTPDTLTKIFGGERESGGLIVFDTPMVCPADQKSTALLGTTCGTLAEPGIAVNRVTRTAAERMLYSEEVVPEGAVFQLHMVYEGERAEVAPVLAVLKNLRLGQSASNGRGYLSVAQLKVRAFDAEAKKNWLSAALQGEHRPWKSYAKDVDLSSFQTPGAAPSARPRLQINLQFHGPFLVNDRERVKARDSNKNKKAPEAYPQINGRGRICLPARSFRGALRSQAERILRTLGHASCGPGTGKRCPPVRKLEDVEKLCLACRVFGAAGWRSPLWVSEFSASTLVGDLPRQEFVAIDRFTGGAAHDKKFDAERPDSIDLDGYIEVEPERICASGYGLLALVLRDLKEGDIQFGLGRAKGYGSCTAELVEIDKLAPLLAEKFAGLVEPGAAIRFRELVDKAVDALLAEVKRRDPEESIVPMAAPMQEDATGVVPGQPTHAPTGGDFLNPYHFVPLAKPNLEVLADGGPVRTSEGGKAWHPVDRIDAKGALSHAHYAPGTHSGRIICRLTAKTPLFIGNEREAGAEGQPTPVKPFELNGRPAIPASSLRGMISSLFEAATGSALRVLDNQLLSYRKPARKTETKLGELGPLTRIARQKRRRGISNAALERIGKAGIR